MLLVAFGKYQTFKQNEKSLPEEEETRKKIQVSNRYLKGKLHVKLPHVAGEVPPVGLGN